MRVQGVPAVVFAMMIAADPARSQELAIDHAAVGCVVAERHPQLQARIDPADGVARARVHFRTAADQPWYAVAMTAQGPAFTATLPRPKKTLESFQYYIEATSRAFSTARTPEHTAAVVGDGAGCQGMMAAGATGSTGMASILVEAPAGAPAVPAGFATTGVAA
ncbi:MAG TPA: hypothetical protein VMR21_10855, partial [Vicinamibacteria bacterium]|nr:hypothetical protein [Vicinamibacteria bacterium]